MKTHRVDEILLILLDHPRKEVLLAVCGVLMNLAADPLFRSVLRELHAVQKLMVSALLPLATATPIIAASTVSPHF
eukprot:COSAG01_NODE_4025_length_5425_cov_242.536050_5_plen_76_part_00